MRDLPDASSLRVQLACEKLMRGGSHSFYAASRILPERLRPVAAAIYAFCRVADDAVDEMPSGASLQVVMAYLHERLDAIYRGEPFGIDADLAFSAVAQAYAIPRTLPSALLEGFEWDACGRRYETIDELHDYSARVAGAVGAMMTLVMGGRSSATVARACELGVAMQLTNIARDVGEDAARGRIYLPLAWMREESVDPETFLQAPELSPGLIRVIRRLLATADQLYSRAETGIACLPRDCRSSIMAARLIYADIGREIRRRGFNSVQYRAVVPGHRKWWLIGRALKAGVLPPSRDFLLRPLPAIRFLVDAVPPGASHGGLAQERPFPVLHLFERLAQRSRSRSRVS
jgi:phytoene synthase